MLLCILVVKNTFIFLQKLAYSWPKTLQTSFNVMFSAKQRWNLCNNTGIQLKHSVLREILAKKPIKTEKNNLCWFTYLFWFTKFQPVKMIQLVKMIQPVQMVRHVKVIQPVKMIQPIKMVRLVKMIQPAKLIYMVKMMQLWKWSSRPVKMINWLERSNQLKWFN